MEKLGTLSMNSTILLLACIFIAFFTSTTSTRILIADDEVGTPSTAPQEPDSVVSPVPPLVTPSPVEATAAAAATTAPLDDQHHTLSFFMHEILGAQTPSARAVTGVVTNPALNAQVAFAKPNGANLPLNAGVPQNNNNAGLLNNNNLPFLTGLGGTTASIFNKNGNFGNNNGVGFSVGNINQLPEGMTLEKLMFGTMTVFDDELTEGEELGSGLVGKAQGFYVASSVDGTSQVMAFTAKFEENGYADSISFFGVHQTQISESQLAIIGGTGKYVNVGGFATIKTFPVNNQQHNTDGIETLVQLTAYLAY